MRVLRAAILKINAVSGCCSTGHGTPVTTGPGAHDVSLSDDGCLLSSCHGIASPVNHGPAPCQSQVTDTPLGQSSSVTPAWASSWPSHKITLEGYPRIHTYFWLLDEFLERGLCLLVVSIIIRCDTVSSFHFIHSPPLSTFHHAPFLVLRLEQLFWWLLL